MAKKKPTPTKKAKTEPQPLGVQIEYVPTEALIACATNARTHPPEQVRQIVNSIREFGFTNPVLIDLDNELVAGHGRVMAANELGMESVPCIRLGHLTDKQIRAYRLADNKIALGSGWDDALLKAEIEALQSLEVDLSIAGFSEDDLAQILVSFQPATQDEQGRLDQKTPIKCPACSHEFTT